MVGDALVGVAVGEQDQGGAAARRRRAGPPGCRAGGPRRGWSSRRGRSGAAPARARAGVAELAGRDRHLHLVVEGDEAEAILGAQPRRAGCRSPAGRRAGEPSAIEPLRSRTTCRVAGSRRRSPSSSGAVSSSRSVDRLLLLDGDQVEVQLGVDSHGWRVGGSRPVSDKPSQTAPRSHLPPLTRSQMTSAARPGGAGGCPPSCPRCPSW